MKTILKQLSFGVVLGMSSVAQATNCSFLSLAQQAGAISTDSGSNFFSKVFTGRTVSPSATYVLREKYHYAVADFLEQCPASQYSYEELKGLLAELDGFKATPKADYVGTYPEYTPAKTVLIDQIKAAYDIDVRVR